MKNTSFRSLRGIIIFASVLFTLKGQSQQSLPKMWIPKANCVERRLWFRFGALQPGDFSKAEVLSSLIEDRHPLSYFHPISSFKDLLRKMNTEYEESIKTLNIYITAFDVDHPGPIKSPFLPDKQLLLVFAPAKGAADYADLGKYYFINPLDNLCYELESSDKKFWTDNYVNNIINTPGGLASTIERVPENIANRRKSDTRSINYDYTYFTEFLTTEVDYQLRQNRIEVSGIQIEFGSYPDTGVDDPTHGKKTFKNRLMVQFEFTKKDADNNDEVFYIDDTPDFAERLKLLKLPLNKNILISLRKLGFDNGQLCPPNCPSDGR